MLKDPIAHALDVALQLAHESAALILPIYHDGFKVQTKDDGSPVTAADLAANDHIVAGLRAAFPTDAILSEEAPFEPGTSGRTWIVDPLDGTSDFANHTDDFTVMIGLYQDGQPVLGVIHAPALDRVWAGGPSFGAFEIVDGARIPRTLSAPTSPLRAIVSRRTPTPVIAALLEALDPPKTMQRGSVGLKIGLILSGEAEIYLHPAKGTSIWDCCGPEALIVGAGGVLTTGQGQPVNYDPAHVGNPEGIVAGHPAAHARAMEVLNAVRR